MSDQDDSNILQFTGQTLVDIPPDQVLAGARGKLDEVVVIGSKPNGDYYLASSTANRKEMLWILECVRIKLLGLDDQS